jgi:predicted CxxxxCH...CXXCH cytochrome family protein
MECHLVPVEVGQEGHVDPLPSEVVFGPLASTGGLRPSWDRETGQCSNVYCHGAWMSGGSNPAPRWTVVDGSQVVCGSCHSRPPPEPHQQRPDCESCHWDTVDEKGELITDGLHINGEVEGI